MQKTFSHWIFYVSSLLATSMVALSSGCASGGFKLTRQAAGWLNSQHIIIRIVLYILASVVFFVTILVDMVIFNTVDFWQGKISAGTYEHSEGEKTYVAKHEYLQEGHLRKSTITIFAKDHAKVQEVVLSETKSGEIEVFIDGQLRHRVQGISELPMLTSYDSFGRTESTKMILFNLPAVVASAK